MCTEEPDIDADDDVDDGTRPGFWYEPESAEPPDLDVSLSYELLDKKSSIIDSRSASCASNVWTRTRAGHAMTSLLALLVV